LADNIRARIEINPQFAERLGQALERRLTAVAMNIEADVVSSISIGQSVKRTKGGFLRGLGPSAEGQPPHVLYGRLRQSIAKEVMRQVGRVIARIGTNMEYARRLELGFVGTDARGRNIHQGPRPFLQPALDRHLKDVAR
jgi:phage gpG-like protein